MPNRYTLVIFMLFLLLMLGVLVWCNPAMSPPDDDYEQGEPIIEPTKWVI